MTRKQMQYLYILFFKEDFFFIRIRHNTESVFIYYIYIKKDWGMFCIAL